MYRFYCAGYCVDQVGVFTSIASFLWTESAGAFLNLQFLVYVRHNKPRHSLAKCVGGGRKKSKHRKKVQTGQFGSWRAASSQTCSIYSTVMLYEHKAHLRSGSSRLWPPQRTASLLRRISNNPNTEAKDLHFTQKMESTLKHSGGWKCFSVSIKNIYLRLFAEAWWLNQIMESELIWFVYKSTIKHIKHNYTFHVRIKAFRAVCN